MMLLDTNVLSEFMRPQPAAQVVAWLDEQPAGAVWTSAVSRAEIELGLALMPRGKRQEGLSLAARVMFEEDFAGRCLPFDEIAASHSARIVSVRTRSGRPISVEDAQIAAIALANQMSLATRNASDFESIDGLTVIDPWVARP
ncbi:type II toxin-antitoxin system VapC family toxin [uncultured Thiocystis sp.]|jgi:predicted nucleic acid-binding protein|uniref:type II toxin-antitoxin system VapC family toxin n=1 Tax=uncultured Thiocystis sp. TaxID=1202134 RepID=UPI0025CF3BFE|nr:type II toxin-antitoxin system VapC family toxin [uncultured Thiocystis sp.]